MIYRSLRFQIISILIVFAGALLCPRDGYATKGAVSSSSVAVIFKKQKIIIAGRVVVVEIADTDERRAQGLMFRESLPLDEGMLFIFENEAQRSFWMRNTLIPLSIGFFDRKKRLTEVIDMQPGVLGETRSKTYPSRTQAMFALEMNLGWYQRNKIRPGVIFKFADN